MIEFGQILVELRQIQLAIADMNKAMELYRDAVEEAKTAAADLASKWEGAAKDAFVAHQENAYNWQLSIVVVVNEMIATIRKAMDMYEQMEAAVKIIVQG